MLELYYCLIAETEHSFFETYLRGLPAHVQNEITKYKFEKDQKLTLYGKWIVASVFKKKNVQLNWEDWQRDRNGKPFLPYGLCFNISHCEGLVVVAFGDGAVGIDIENISDKPLDLMAMFHPNEQRYVHNSLNKQAAFFEIWTKKEAYLKARGCGLQEELSVSDCTKDWLEDESGRWHFTSLDFLDRYRLSVCVLAPKSAERVFLPPIVNLRQEAFSPK